MAAAAGDFIPPSSIVSLPPQGSRVHEIHSDPNPVLAEDLGFYFLFFISVVFTPFFSFFLFFSDSQLFFLSLSRSANAKP